MVILFIIFFVMDIVFTAIYNHYKRVENGLLEEQNKILWDCYKLDAEIIRIDHELLKLLQEKNGGTNNE